MQKEDTGILLFSLRIDSCTSVYTALSFFPRGSQLESRWGEKGRRRREKEEEEKEEDPV